VLGAVVPEALRAAQRAQQRRLAAQQPRQVLAQQRQAGEEVLQQLRLAVQPCGARQGPAGGRLRPPKLGCGT
jgi:hypothetical protein